MWILLLIACFLHIAVQTILIWAVFRNSPYVIEKKVALPQPLKPTILSIKEDLMNYIYTIALPALGADDVVSRELHVIIDGVEEIHEITDIHMTEWTLTLAEDTHCLVYITDIDDAGNRSPDGMHLEFTVIDTIPPSAPEAPVIVDVIEEKEEVTEEPVVEEEVTEEPVVEEEVTEEPVVEEEVTEEPVVEEEVTEEPVVEEEVTEEPVVEEEVTEEPVVEEETTEDEKTE